MQSIQLSGVQAASTLRIEYHERQSHEDAPYFHAVGGCETQCATDNSTTSTRPVKLDLHAYSMGI